MRYLLFAVAAAWFPAASLAASDPPTGRALLAEHDAELVKGALARADSAFDLPDDLPLDASLREAAAPLAMEMRGRLRVLIPAWIAEERAVANDPNLRGAGLAQALYSRSLNEIAIGSVESAGPAHDEAALKAALAPGACRNLPSSYFAQRITMIQAAPIEVRATLLTAEKALLARWGTARQGLPARPTPAELGAAEQAVARLRDGLPVTAEPMVPFLSERVFAQTRDASRPDRWEVCVRSQWWLRSQLAEPGADRMQALRVYRYSTMPDVTDRVPAGGKPGSGPTRSADGTAAYPRAAGYFHVEGSTRLKIGLDEQGKVIDVAIVERRIRVPGVRNNRPVAFEGLFDDAAIEFARQRTYPAGTGREAQFVMDWKLEEEAHEAR